MNPQQELQKLLEKLVSKQEKLADAKATLKQYKFKSELLSDLTKAKKELLEQIREEKDRIEDEFYEDKDYEQAKNDQLTLKNEIKETSSEIKEVSKGMHPDQMLLTLDYNVKGEAVKLQFERVQNFYFNGKQLK